jgi:hypothetical protein
MTISFQAPIAADAPNAPNTQKSVEDRSTTFRPVQGGPEMQSGERLLVEAYAAIWIILFALILLGWRRQKRIDARLAGLELAVAQARSDASAKNAGGA